MSIGNKPPADFRYAYRRPRTMRQVAIGQFLVNLAAWTLVGLIGFGWLIGIGYLIGLVF